MKHKEVDVASMANKGSNKARFWDGDIPDIGGRFCNGSHKLSIRGETAIAGFLISCMELSYNFSSSGILNCDNPSTTEGKLSMVWGERKGGGIE